MGCIKSLPAKTFVRNLAHVSLHGLTHRCKLILLVGKEIRKRRTNRQNASPTGVTIIRRPMYAHATSSFRQSFRSATEFSATIFVDIRSFPGEKCQKFQKWNFRKKYFLLFIAQFRNKGFYSTYFRHPVLVHWKKCHFVYKNSTTKIQA